MEPLAKQLQPAEKGSTAQMKPVHQRLGALTPRVTADDEFFLWRRKFLQADVQPPQSPVEMIRHMFTLAGKQVEHVRGAARVLPVSGPVFLAAFLAWKRTLPTGGWAGLAGAFVAAALVINLIPFVPEGDTQLLAIMHLPMALWIAVGVAYAGGVWRDSRKRMNYVRFTGEWFILFCQNASSCASCSS